MIYMILNNLFYYVFNYYIKINERIIIILNKHIIMNNNNYLNKSHFHIFFNILFLLFLYIIIVNFNNLVKFL